MKETLLKVQALQEVNEQIERSRRDMEALGLDVRNQQRITEEKKRRCAQAHEQRIEAAKRADATQLRMEEREQEIARLDTQLNVAKHQREYDAIQHTILSHRADLRKWEDEGLSALQRADELAESEKLLQHEVRQAEQDLEKIGEDVASGQAELQRRIDKMEEERARIRQGINPAVLSAYDRLSRRHRSRALAEVKARICQGCFTRVTKQTENLLMRGDKIVYCHSCGRMLLLSE